ncbi:hypothetical protein AFA2_02011 [Alcaligenes faecalis subsp. faecalis NBRC 13111]|nr:hypothetical protein AFA2_02011 [Alcaligenes faecalis subsp. faecalis NBRC 13111]
MRRAHTQLQATVGRHFVFRRRIHIDPAITHLDLQRALEISRIGVHVGQTQLHLRRLLSIPTITGHREGASLTFRDLGYAGNVHRCQCIIVLTVVVAVVNNRPRTLSPDPFRQLSAIGRFPFLGNDQRKVFFAFKNIIVSGLHGDNHAINRIRGQFKAERAVAIVSHGYRISANGHHRWHAGIHITVIGLAVLQLQRDRGDIVNRLAKIHIEAARTAFADQRVSHCNRRRIVILNSRSDRAAMFNFFVVAAGAAFNTHFFWNVALYRTVIWTRGIGNETGGLTVFNDNFLAVGKLYHKVTALRWIIYGSRDGNLITFRYGFRAFQRNSRGIVVVNNVTARRTAGIQVLVITAGCAIDTDNLRTIALLINIIRVRIVDNDTAFCFAYRNGNGAAIGQGDNQVLPCYWPIYTGNDLIGIAFSNSLRGLQRDCACPSHQCWIFITTGIATQTHVFNVRHARTWVFQSQWPRGLHNADQTGEAAATAFATTGQYGSSRIQLREGVIACFQSS